MTKYENRRLVEIYMDDNPASKRWLIYGRFGQSNEGYAMILLQEIKYPEADMREKYLEFWKKRMNMKLHDVWLILSGINQNSEIY